MPKTNRGLVFFIAILLQLLLVPSLAFGATPDKSIKSTITKSVVTAPQGKYGFVVREGDWLYYSYAKGKMRGNIYKSKVDGSSKKLLTKDLLCDNLVIVGDWIYYTTKTSDNSLVCRIKKDGTQRTILSREYVFYFYIDQGWIYYSLEDFSVHKMKLDGTGKTSLRVSNGVNFFSVTNGWIYFLTSEKNKEVLYKMKTNGTSKVRLIADDVANFFSIVGNWIYYVNKTDKDSIYKIKVDGKAKTKVITGTTKVGYYALDVIGDWIYTTRYDKDNNKSYLFKVKLDGTKLTRLSTDDRVFDYQVIGNQIYYLTNTSLDNGYSYENFQYYSVPITGGTRKEVFN